MKTAGASAPDPRRVDPADGMAYTEPEFVEFYGQAIGLAKWLQAAAPEETRVDPADGVAYTKEDYLEFYGQVDGLAKWLQAGAARLSTMMPRLAPHLTLVSAGRRRETPPAAKSTAGLTPGVRLRAVAVLRRLMRAAGAKRVHPSNMRVQLLNTKFRGRIAALAQKVTAPAAGPAAGGVTEPA